MEVHALLFDLDGTLLDSAPDLVGALNWVRGTEGLRPLAVEAMSRHASRGAAGLLQAGMPQAEPQRFEMWRQAFLDRYAEYHFVESRLYDGVAELLDFLDARRIGWGIVTNKWEHLTRAILEAAGLDGRAGCVVCGDTLARSKPDPAPVLHACELLRAQPAQTLFAGDDVRDLQAGRAAGTQVAAACWGYGSHELDDEFVGASLRVHQPRDLIPFLEHNL